MNQFTLLMGRLPLSGKFAVHMTLFKVIAATKPRSRWINYILFIGLMSFMAYAHGKQASMGIDALFFASPIWAKVISAAYAVINIGVVILHVHLVCRATKCVQRKQYSRVSRGYTGYSWSEILTAAIVTLGGQLVFMAQYLWYFPY